MPQEFLVIFSSASGVSSNLVRLRVCFLFLNKTSEDKLSPSLSPCPDFAVRLVDRGDTLNRGRVEVYHADEWGSICDDFFGFEEAVVICHELGFPSAEDALP